MRWLAEYVMGGRSRAILVAASSAVLALAAPPLSSPLSYLGGAVIALGTLRFGAREGLLVLGGAALGTGVLGYLVLGQGQAVAFATLLLWVPACLLALVLRRTESLTFTLQMAALLGIVVLSGVYISYGDPAPWWQETLAPALTPLLEQSGIQGDPQQLLEHAAGIMTGVLAGVTVLGLIVTLFLARAWQAMLYNPGGFRVELHGLGMTPLTGWITLGILAVTQFGDGQLAELARQSSIIVLVLYFVVGLALVHGVLGILGTHPGTLIAVYVGMFLLPAQIFLLLTIVGFSDSWINYRGRLIAARKKD